MGVQGNYPGTGAINQHKHLAMRGEVSSPSEVSAVNMNEGGSSSGSVDDPRMPAGKGSAGDSTVTPSNSFGESFASGHRPGDVYGNIP